MTNLSGGLLRGMQEARRVAGDGGATLLLLSDGHANAGETDRQRLAGVAAGAHEHGITTTTVGIGRDYDESLLAEVARGGQGSHVFAEHGDAAAAAVAGEVDGLLSKTVQAASLVIRPDAAVDTVTVWNDLPGVADRRRHHGRARRPLGGRAAQARAHVRRTGQARPRARAHRASSRFATSPSPDSRSRP